MMPHFRVTVLGERFREVMPKVKERVLSLRTTSPAGGLAVAQ